MTSSECPHTASNGGLFCSWWIGVNAAGDKGMFPSVSESQSRVECSKAELGTIDTELCRIGSIDSKLSRTLTKAQTKQMNDNVSQ